MVGLIKCPSLKQNSLCHRHKQPLHCLLVFPRNIMAYFKKPHKLSKKRLLQENHRAAKQSQSQHGLNTALRSTCSQLTSFPALDRPTGGPTPAADTAYSSPVLTELNSFHIHLSFKPDAWNIRSLLAHPGNWGPGGQRHSGRCA